MASTPDLTPTGPCGQCGALAPCGADYCGQCVASWPLAAAYAALRDDAAKAMAAGDMAAHLAFGRAMHLAADAYLHLTGADLRPSC